MLLLLFFLYPRYQGSRGIIIIIIMARKLKLNNVNGCKRLFIIIIIFFNFVILEIF